MGRFQLPVGGPRRGRYLPVRTCARRAAARSITCQSNRAADAPAPGAEGLLGRLETFPAFKSTHIRARRVDVWLPPGYDAAAAAGEGFPVLYAHDGQNLFVPELSYTRVPWGVDKAVVALAAEGRARPCIVVGVWSTDDRWREYMPAEPLRWLQRQYECWYETVEEQFYNPLSDPYLQMLVSELKPFVDASFSTLPGREHTYTMGSSMGGLVSLYALQTHPEVFSAAACLSTHWPPARGLCSCWATGAVPDATLHRVYFDRGTEGLDAGYGELQAQVDGAFLQAGYQQGVNFESRCFEGAQHNEAAWAARLEIPLSFLLQPCKQP